MSLLSETAAMKRKTIYLTLHLEKQISTVMVSWQEFETCIEAVKAEV